MRMRIATVFVFVLCTVLSSSHGISTRKSSGLEAREECDIKCVTDRIVFEYSMAEFRKAEAARDPPTVDWEDYGRCDHTIRQYYGNNFLYCCKRHYFGYRNLQKQNRYTEANRAKLDENLKKDLADECSWASPFNWRGVECRKIADEYYKFVRSGAQAWWW